MHKIRRLLCLIFVLAIVFSLSACSGTKSDSYKISSEGISFSESKESENKNLFYQPLEREKLIRVSRNDLNVLYFDKATMSISVYDASAKRLWNSLPDSYIDSQPAVLKIDILAGNRAITLNSQSDSVEKGLAEYKIEKGRVTVTYRFEEKLSDGSVINFVVPAVFGFEGQAVTAKINCSEIDTSLCSDNVVLKGIHFLEYFGSCESASDGDYIFLPEGCGVTLDISEKEESFSPVKLSVYGSDPSVKSAQTKESCYVAAFGMKKENSAFIALIQEGDSLATITADKALKNSGSNRVGASFELTSYCTNEDGAEIFVSNNRYSGNINIAYRFLSGSNASYCGMAGACRELLIRNGAFSLSKKEETKESLPFVLNLIASANIGEKNSVKALTTFEQAEDVLSILRSKGLGNIVLRYSGLFSGSLKQRSASSVSLLSSLGTEEEYQEFLSFVNSQNIDFFADAKLISGEKGAFKNPAVSLSGKKTAAEIVDFKNSVISSGGETALASTDEISENANTLINKFNSFNISGICLSDAGKLLFSDFNQKNYSDRIKLQNTIRTQTQALSASKSLMVDQCNIYTVKYADYITNLPTSSVYASKSGYSSVPFMQILLRSVSEYSSSSINLSSNTENAVLKAAEYGCIPSFTLYYSDLSSEDKADNCYYLNQMSLAQSSYERLSNTLSSLRNKRITDHYKVKKGVWCTEYEGGINVYVNYNNKDVVVNGITLEEKSFLKVG